MKPNEYKCSMCGNIYELGQDDDAAKQECIENFGIDPDEEDCDIICDDCYNLLIRVNGGQYGTN